MEGLVGGAPFLDRQAVPRHQPERRFHRPQMIVGAPPGGQRRRLGLDDPPQLEQIGQQPAVGLVLENPRQHVGVEQMPLLARADAGADLRPRFDQPLGGEDAHCLAVGGARDAQLVAGGNLILEHEAGRIFARDDADAEVAGDRPVDAQRIAPGLEGQDLCSVRATP